MPSQSELVSLFRELTELLILEEGGPQTFRVRAYENATDAIKASHEDLANMSASKLAKLEGIGKSTAQKIREYYDTGRIARLDELREKYPADFVALSRIPGVGPKTLLRLRSELGVENLADLKRVIEQQAIRELKGMGAKSEEKIAKAIERIGSKQDRRPIGKALPLAETLVAELEELDEVEEVQYAGSLRRFRETVADIDIVVASTEPAPIMETFVNMPRAKDVLGHGDTKSSIVTDTGIQVDLRVVPPESYGAALLYFTGSKAHNIHLRQRALDRGYTLNEYGLVDVESGETVAQRSESDIYEALGMEWVAPEMREGLGEVDAAAAGELPDLVEVGDLLGDLHLHCDFSGDAQSPIEDVVRTAHERGYQYLAITDHAEDLAINGVSEAEHMELAKRLDALRDEYPDMLLLHGAELNIGKRGELDYSDEMKARFDMCVASVHGYFDLDREEQTARLIKAMEHPVVRIVGHLLARTIGGRPGIEIDVDAVLQAAIDNHVAIEVNSGLSRLDAPDHILRRAVELGCLFAINSDAHHIDHMEGIRYGVRQSHRGWLPKDRVINTWEKEKFRDWLNEAG